MKKLVLFLVVCCIPFTLSSCVKRTVVSYGDEQFSMKESPSVAAFQNLDLKEEGFKKVSDTPEDPPYPIDDPNTMSFYPVSETGHESTSPFYLHQLPMEYSGEGGPSARTSVAWWRPGLQDAGIYHIQFKATDSKGISATQTVTITVLEAINKPPILFAKYVMGEK